jgi:hypothetical protein
MTATDFKKEIASLWEKADDLKKYGKRPFTLDGLLLGSLGESFAETKFELTLIWGIKQLLHK